MKKPITEINIKITKEKTGWKVFCPEWKHESYTKNLTRLVAILVAEIENTLGED